MHEIKAKWANLDDDSAWVRSLLCWYSNSIAGDSVQVEIPSNARKPNMHEPMLLSDDGKLVSNMTGEVFAVFGNQCASALDFHCAAPNNKLCLTIRYTDLNLQQVTPHAFYFQLMCECLELNRPNVCRLEMRVLNTTKKLIQVGSEVKIEYSSSSIRESEEWIFRVMFENVVLCKAVVCLCGEKHSKYDSTRKICSSQHFVDHAVQTRNRMDNAPVTCTMMPFQHEITPVALPYSYLLLATLGVGEISSHAFPPDSPFHTDLQANGQQKYIFFWRSAAIQVFDTKVNCSNGGLVCVSWIQNTGKSSLELRCDFSLANDARRRVVAATCFTLVQLDITTRRPAALFYNRAWAEQRYAYGKESQVSNRAFALPQDVLRVGWSSPPFRYALDIRHADQDAHQHLNSISYTLLIENAKHAYYQQEHCKGLLDKTNSEAETKMWIEYRSELHRRHSDACILVQHQITNGGNKLWLRFDFYNSTINTPSTVVYVETTLTSNKL